MSDPIVRSIVARPAVPAVSPTILMADDDADDCLLARAALEENFPPTPLHVGADGAGPMGYPHRRGANAGPGSAPRPGLVLLDQSMPRKGADVHRADNVGATPSSATPSSARPATVAGLVEAPRAVGRYWFQLVELPTGPAGMGGPHDG